MSGDAQSVAAMPARGALVALEGIDGSGTTTQTRQLVDALVRGSATTPPLRAAATCEPSTGKLGRLLREALAARPTLDPGAMALAFAADRLDHWAREVAPLLQQGIHVITDRYVYSSLAYQSVLLPESWVFAINARAPEPLLTIYLQLDPQVAARRREQRGQAAELYETEPIQRAVAARYDDLLGASMAAASWQLAADGDWRRAGPLRQRHGRASEVAIVDAALPLAVVHEQIVRLVDTVLRSPPRPGE
ncbi:MAG: dTMP kinase [Proteobacteria bacterium]|nr:dTMP kinase [Pseudomonadota bacterium]